MSKLIRTKFEPEIQKILSGEFEYALLSAAFDNLEVSGPLCCNNFSYALRELVRHVLHRLASDENVKECSWFKPDKNARGGITRAHRIKYAIQGGLSDKYGADKLYIHTKPVIDNLVRTVNALSEYTHIQPATFDLARDDTLCHAKESLEAAVEFVQHITECREQVIEALSSKIDEKLLIHALSEVSDSVDCLSTHHWVDEVTPERIDIIEIGPRSINLSVCGSIDYELQYGSDSDVANDLGDVNSASFPFKAKLTVEFVRPLGKSATVDKFKVDTSEWYE